MKLLIDDRQHHDLLLEILGDVPGIAVDERNNQEKLLLKCSSGDYDLALIDFKSRSSLGGPIESGPPLWMYSFEHFEGSRMKVGKAYGAISFYTLMRDSDKLVSDLSEFQRNLRVSVI